MAQDLGVTCGKEEESLIIMILNLEKREKIEADRLGNRIDF